jgi:integrase
MWRITKLGERKAYLFDEAAIAFLKSHTEKRDYRSKVQHIRFWRTHFGGMALCSLTTEAIGNALPTHRRSQYGKARPLSGATKNRYLATLSKLLNDCVRRGWLDVSPYIEKFAEAPIREVIMTPSQAVVFLSALPEGWMRDVCAFALATGMRAGEILSLEWAQVQIERRLVSVLASKAKSGSSRPVPLNDDALAVILRRQGLNERHVFARIDKPAAEIDRRPFSKAAKAAGLPAGFRFHDLRHSWASAHAVAGTPLLTLQRLGGWKTLAMLNRYAHLSADDLAQYAGNGLIYPHSNNLSQSRPALSVVNG